jgi:hypothetical protein
MKKLLLFVCCLAFPLVSCASGGSDNEISNRNSQRDGGVSLEEKPEVTVQLATTLTNENLTEVVTGLTGVVVALERRIADLESCVAEIENELSWGADTSRETAGGYGHSHEVELWLLRC